MMRKAAAVLAALAVVAAAAGQSFASANFDDLALGAESYWNGSDGSGGFVTGGVTFQNQYTVDPFTGWGWWAGWAYSNTTDTTTGGYTNQYSAITGGGQTGANYGVAYCDAWTPTVPTFILTAPATIKYAYFTNTTYAYHDMLNGSSYSKKFGGGTGTDPDWFLLTITGKDAGGAVTGTVAFYLADYRFANSADDYLVDTWTKVDLSGLGTVQTVEFALSSSDSSIWGMNTPAYFAMDTLAVPEPASLALVAAGLSGLLAARRRR